jgi:hypothetical protein
VPWNARPTPRGRAFPRPGTGSVDAVEDDALTDGTYDAFVVDAEDAPGGGTALELTITAGEHKGMVTSLRSTGSLGDPIDLLGMPATLTVTDGVPSVRIDRA